MRNAIFVDFEERNTASVDVWVIFGSFSEKNEKEYLYSIMRKMPQKPQKTIRKSVVLLYQRM